MEEKNDVSQANSKWTGMVPVDDTALAVTDTGGRYPVVYLNGQFATQGYWRKSSPTSVRLSAHHL